MNKIKFKLMKFLVKPWFKKFNLELRGVGKGRNVKVYAMLTGDEFWCIIPWSWMII